jgi:hypothetical protein
MGHFAPSNWSPAPPAARLRCLTKRAISRAPFPQSSAARAIYVDSCAAQALQANEDIYKTIGSFSTVHSSLSVE